MKDTIISLLIGFGYIALIVVFLVENKQDITLLKNTTKKEYQATEKDKILDEEHWSRCRYTQRITLKQWRTLLLNGDDKIIFHGRPTQLKAEYLGAGVYEIGKEAR